MADKESDKKGTNGSGKGINIALWSSNNGPSETGATEGSVIFDHIAEGLFIELAEIEDEHFPDLESRAPEELESPAAKTLLKAKELASKLIDLHLKFEDCRELLGITIADLEDELDSE